MTSLSKSLFISLIIGLSLSIIFSMISNGEHYYPLAPDSTFGQLYYQHFNEPTVMLLSIIIWLLIGMVFFATNFIFTHTDWSITTATASHFVCSYLGFLPLATFAGWFNLDLSHITKFTIIFIIIYMIIWVVSFLKNRRYVNEINQQLQQRLK